MRLLVCLFVALLTPGLGSANIVESELNLGLPSYPMVGNPINQATGNKFEVETDYLGSGPFPLAMTRFYNSRAKENSKGFGSNWQGQYDRSVTVITRNGYKYVSISRPDGKKLRVDYGENYQIGPSTQAHSVAQLVQLTDAAGKTTGWTYTAEDDSTETFDADGKLQFIVNRAGFKQTLTYDLTNQLVSVRDPAGRQLSLTYDAAGRVASMTTPNNGQYTYAYDANNNLLSVTYPDNTVRQYLYNEPTYTQATNLPHALTGLIDENNNRYATWEYDTKGRAISSEHAGGVDKTTLDFQANATTTVTNALGNQLVYAFSSYRGVLVNTSVQGSGCACDTVANYSGYDEFGFLSYSMDFSGNMTYYLRDEKGRVTSRTDAVGGVITTTWHSTFQLPLEVVEAGHTTSYAYDAQGNLTKKTITDGTTTHVWTYTFTNGLLTKIDGPRGDLNDFTTFTYDSQWNLASATNASGHSTRFTSYDTEGKVLTLIDLNGLTTVFTYDLHGRLTSTTRSGLRTAYQYDAAGQLIKTTLPNGSYIQYSYDNAHRLIQLADNLNNRIQYQLDAMGNRTQTSSHDPAGTLKSVINMAYDQMSQLTSITDAYTRTTSFSYDAQGNRSFSTDPLNQMTYYSYDPVNRLIVVSNALNGSTILNYDTFGQLVTVQDPAYLNTNYTFDGFGNHKTQQSPDTGTTTNTYDTADNLKTSQDARGNTTIFTYDAINRITKVAYAAGTATTFEYDGGSAGAANAKGHLTKMTDESGQTTYTYDALSRLLTKVQTVGSGTSAKTFTMAYVYGSSGNALGKLTNMTYPSGNRVNFSYDAAGRTISLTLNPTNANGVGTDLSKTIILLTSIGYTPFGLANSWAWGNNSSTSINTYARNVDLNGRLSSYPLGNEAVNGVIRTLDYDAAGQIIGYTHSGGVNSSNLNQTFGYDALGELSSFFRNNTNQDFLYYDPNGNRVQAVFGASVYDYTMDTSNRLMTTTGPLPAKTNTYDAAGNLTGDGTVTYVYSARGRMASSKKGTNTINYLYNGTGQRIKKAGPTAIIATGSNMYGYDEAGHLIGEYNANGALIEETIYLGDLPVAVLKQTVTAGVTSTLPYYIYADHINTPRVITRASDNKMVWRWDDSDPFGMSQPNENPGNLGAFTYNPRFPGQLYDKETNLHYNYLRDYDPKTGRYVQSDPIGLAGGINTYTYVGNNPLRYIDSRGLRNVHEISSPSVAIKR
jgi:RHS repeat-associated protein